MGRKLMLTFDVGDEVVGLPKSEKGRAGGDERRANDPALFGWWLLAGTSQTLACRRPDLLCRAKIGLMFIGSKLACQQVVLSVWED